VVELEVALELGRKAILIELSAAYVQLIKQRTTELESLAFFALDADSPCPNLVPPCSLF
jgi:DNA modification methylase